MESRPEGLRASVQQALSEIEALADQHADLALYGERSHARQREIAEAALTKAATILRVAITESD